jgi:putative heme transporter
MRDDEGSVGVPVPVQVQGVVEVEREPDLRPPSGWGPPVRLVVAAAAMAAGLWLTFLLRGVLLQVLVAIILAAGLSPLVDWLNRRGVPRGLAVVLIYLVFLLALVGLGFLLVPPVVGQVQSLIAQAPDFGNRILASLENLQKQLPFLPPIGPTLQQQVQNLGNQIGAIGAQALTVLGFALGVFGGLLTAVLTLLITFYLIVDGPRIRSYLLGFLPASHIDRARRVTDNIGARMGGWLLGQIVLSSAIGLASFVALSIIGVSNALLLAVVAGVAELIPLIGPWIAAVPAVLVAFTQSPLTALFTVIAYVVIQQLESNLLAPRIMGRAVRLHPLAVILALLVGASLLGIAGALVAVPVASALSALLDEVRPTQEAA